MPEKIYDVLIIGGGVVGCCIARELARYRLRIALLEKEWDVAQETSCRNSGVIHSGIHYAPGTLRARLCVEGNALMESWCRELKVKRKVPGKLTVALENEELKTLEHLKEQGEANGVCGLERWGPEAMEKFQPGVWGRGALYSPTTGIVDPWGLAIAAAENALAAGASFFLGCRATEITKEEPFFCVKTDQGGRFVSRLVINASGLHSDKMAAMAGIRGYRIYPCRGEYFVLDRRLGDRLRCLVYPAPHEGPSFSGLGVHLTPTVEGNILVGPSAEYQEDPEDNGCTRHAMEVLEKEGKALLPGLKTADIIRTFAGVRPRLVPPARSGFEDFVIEDRSDLPGFINLVGIESPGLTAAPAIAVHVASLSARLLSLEPNPRFLPERPGSERSFRDLSLEEQNDLASSDPAYGEIVCRCECVTKGEILKAIENPLGVRTLAGIKYRSRAMMGRCQGGFCSSRIVRILREDFGYQVQDFLWKGPRSPLFTTRQ